MTGDGVAAKVHANSGSSFSLKVELMFPGLKGWACGKAMCRESQVLPGLSGTLEEGLSVNWCHYCTVKPRPQRTGLFLIAAQGNLKRIHLYAGRAGRICRLWLAVSSKLTIKKPLLMGFPWTIPLSMRRNARNSSRNSPNHSVHKTPVPLSLFLCVDHPQVGSACRKGGLCIFRLSSSLSGSHIGTQNRLWLAQLWSHSLSDHCSQKKELLWLFRLGSYYFYDQEEWGPPFDPYGMGCFRQGFFYQENGTSVDHPLWKEASPNANAKKYKWMLLTRFSGAQVLHHPLFL